MGAAGNAFKAVNLKEQRQNGLRAEPASMRQFKLVSLDLKSFFTQALRLDGGCVIRTPVKTGKRVRKAGIFEHVLAQAQIIFKVHADSVSGIRQVSGGQRCAAAERGV